MIDAKIARRAVLAGLAASCAAPAAAAPEFDAAQFGFRVSPGGNALAQERMRLHAVANPGSVYRFAPGVYDLTTPRFLFGVRDIEIHAHGASFRNVNAGTFGYSDLDAAFYIGSGSLFHPMGGGNLDPSQATSGDLIRDALAGERAVALRAPERAAAFAPGSWALVHWFSRQQRSFPPNPGYFDYVKILAADPARGTLALDRPLQFAYRARAPDDLSDAGLYNVATGRARILSLQRHDYQICERFVLRGGRGVATGFGKAPPNPYDGIIEVAGAIDVELTTSNSKASFPRCCAASGCSPAGFPAARSSTRSSSRWR